MKYTTSIESHFEGEYLFTTDCKEIYNKLKRRKGFFLVIWPLHKDYWTFEAPFPNTQEALNVLNSLTNKKAVKIENRWEVEH